MQITSARFRNTLTRVSSGLEYETDSIRGVRRVRQELPDLIILDIQMDPLDGFGVLHRLRDSKHTRDIPVVIYSIVGEDDETILRGLGLGVDQTVHKGRRGALRLLEARLRYLLAIQENTLHRVPVKRFCVGEHELLVYGDGESVVRDGTDIALSRIQRSVLARLADAEGAFVHTNELSRFLYQDLLGDQDWKYERDRSRFYRYMNGLRKRVEPDPQAPIFIENQRDVGYCLRGFVR